MEELFPQPHDFKDRFQRALETVVAAELRGNCATLWESALRSRSVTDAEELCRLVLGPLASCDANPLPDGRWFAEVEYDHVLHDGCGSDAVEAILIAMCSSLDGIGGLA